MYFVKSRISEKTFGLENSNFSKPVLLYYLGLYFIQIISLSIFEVNPDFWQYPFTLAIFIPLIYFVDFTPFVFSLFFVTDQYFITEETFLISGNKIILLFLITLVYGFIRKGVPLKNKDFIFVVIFILYLFVIDKFFNVSIFDNAYFLNISTILILFVYLNKKSAFVLLNYGLILSSFVVAISFIIIFIQKGQQLYGVKFSDGGFRDPNYLSSVIGVGYILSISYIFSLIENQTKKIAWPHYVVAFFCLFAIILSGSRGSFLSVVITTVIVVVSRIKRSSIWSSAIFLSLFGIILYALVQYGFFDLLLYRFFEEDSFDTASGRTLILDQLIQNFGNLQFEEKLFGGGYGSFAKLTTDMDPHNDLASIITSYGILGLGIFLLMLLRLLKPFRSAALVFLLYFLLVSLSISSFKTMAMPLLLLSGLNIKKYCNE
jgi:hypothetical protein